MTLDELAAEWPVGTRIRTRHELSTVVGVCWGIPRRPGEPDEPTLVVDTQRGTLGNVYPDEVIARTTST